MLTKPKLGQDQPVVDKVSRITCKLGETCVTYALIIVSVRPAEELPDEPQPAVYQTGGET